jgi:hypothetical protein
MKSKRDENFRTSKLMSLLYVWRLLEQW